jgi:hypothetical protein
MEPDLRSIAGSLRGRHRRRMICINPSSEARMVTKPLIPHRAASQPKQPRPRQPPSSKIFYFTEIRFWRMCRPSRLTLEGRPCVVMVVEPGLRWTRQRRARKCGQGGLLSVSPRLRVDERRCQVRLASILPVTSTTPGDNAASSEPCVRQNCVVLAVVATVKPWRMRHLRQPARRRDFRWGEGGQNELGSRESTA